MAGEGRLPGDTGATSANPVKGLMDRASTWAPGSLPSGLGTGMWSPDVLAGLYYGWNTTAQRPGSGQPADLAAAHACAGASAPVPRRGTPVGTAQGNWRSVAQAAAAAASQLEISKLSGSKSARSAEQRGEASALTPSASLGKAQFAPAAQSGIPARFNKVTDCLGLVMYKEGWSFMLILLMLAADA